MAPIDEKVKRILLCYFVYQFEKHRNALPSVVVVVVAVVAVVVGRGSDGTSANSVHDLYKQLTNLCFSI